MITRDRKILHICQGHVAPGMSLIRWREILAAHGVFPDWSGSWDGVSDVQVAGIFQEIAGIVRAARVAATAEIPQIETGPEAIRPLDLYKP